MCWCVVNAVHFKCILSNLVIWVHMVDLTGHPWVPGCLHRVFGWMVVLVNMVYLVHLLNLVIMVNPEYLANLMFTVFSIKFLPVKRCYMSNKHMMVQIQVYKIMINFFDFLPFLLQILSQVCLFINCQIRAGSSSQIRKTQQSFRRALPFIVVSLSTIKTLSFYSATLVQKLMKRKNDKTLRNKIAPSIGVLSAQMIDLLLSCSNTPNPSPSSTIHLNWKNFSTSYCHGRHQRPCNDEVPNSRYMMEGGGGLEIPGGSHDGWTTVETGRSPHSSY